MAKPGSPLFLERGSYRQRRVMDAVRLLVFLGAGLWMVPLLWPVPGGPEAPAVPMSRALLYVFGVWCGLIVVSFFLSDRLRRMPASSDKAGDA